MSPVPFSVRPSRRSRGPLATATALALCGLLAACSAGGDDGVASLSSPDADPAGTSDAGSGSDPSGEFATCLRDNGVADVTLEGDIVEVGGPESAWVSSVDESGSTTTEVNGVDISEAWDTCMEQVPAYEDILTAAAEEYGQQSDEGARNWVQCARDNGFTQFADPTDGVIMLPEGLTVEQAEAVVEACPLVDISGLGASGDVDDAVLDAFSFHFSAS